MGGFGRIVAGREDGIVVFPHAARKPAVFKACCQTGFLLGRVKEGEIEKREHKVFRERLIHRLLVVGEGCVAVDDVLEAFAAASSSG